MQRIKPDDIEQKPGEHLDIALGAKMLFEIDGLGLRFKSVFLGAEPGRYFMVRLPSDLNLRQYLHVDRQVTVRYLPGGGRVSGFKTHILDHTTRPYPILFVEYPKTLEVLNSRKSERISCFLPAIIEYENTSTQGVIYNMSMTGCRASHDLADAGSPPDVRVGDAISLHFRLVSQEVVARVGGTIRNFVVVDTKMTFGVQFGELAPMLAERIKEYIDSVKEYSL